MPAPRKRLRSSSFLPFLPRVHIHIQNEVAERRAFVTRTKQSLVKIWNNLESEYVKGKISNDERDVSTYS